MNGWAESTATSVIGPVSVWPRLLTRVSAQAVPAPSRAAQARSSGRTRVRARRRRESRVRGRGVSGGCARSGAAENSGDRRRLSRRSRAREGAALVLSITSHLSVFTRPAGRCSGIIPPSLLPFWPRGDPGRVRRAASRKCQKSRAVSIIYCRPPPVPASNLAVPAGIGVGGEGREAPNSATCSIAASAAPCLPPRVVDNRSTHS